MIVLLFLLVGCGAQPMSRDALVTEYNQSISAERVRSSVPLPHEPLDLNNPPIVVNWWYAGELKQRYYFVKRELTWDATGQALGSDLWYRVSTDAMSIQNSFKKTRNARRWVPLYEMGLEGFPPPDDLVTRRQIPNPIDQGIEQQPQAPIAPVEQ